MFVTFIATALIVTGAVAVLAFIPTWWMLAIALAFHAVGTVVVFVAVMAATTDRTDANAWRTSGAGRHVGSWWMTVHRWTARRLKRPARRPVARGELD
jgi:purine-cytosine permease-like protein